MCFTGTGSAAELIPHDSVSVSAEKDIFKYAARFKSQCKIKPETNWNKSFHQISKKILIIYELSGYRHSVWTIIDRFGFISLCRHRLCPIMRPPCKNV